MRGAVLLMTLVVAGAVAAQESARDAADEPQDSETRTAAAGAAEAEPGGVKTLSGMSILGNEEAPKSLVIVPWKSSRIGDGLGVADSMDDRARPVDKEVFMREVHYYELRSVAEE